MLELASVSKHFGGLSVLEDVSLEVPDRSIFGLIGPNGAGKTTVFNLVTGLVTPGSGTISLEGNSLLHLAPHEIARRGVARTFQNIRIFRRMTLLDNVIVGMHSRLRYGVGQWLLSLKGYRTQERHAAQRARELLSWVGLDAKAEEMADSLSYGEQRRLEIASALATEPKLLLLDEPVAGMNGKEKDDLMSEIKRVASRGVTVFIIEHDMRFVMGLCDQIAVLNFGRIIANGRPAAIRSDPVVVEAYLGCED